MAWPSDLLEALKPFHERASEAEDRLTKLEAVLATKQDAKNDELLKKVSELQSQLTDAQAAQASEKRKASEEAEKLLAENEKLKYRITHLVRALKENDKKLAKDNTRGCMYRYPSGCGAPDAMPGVPVPYPRDASLGPMPAGDLAIALVNAPIEQQRTMLSENLYLFVDQLDHEHAAKVTRLLLEMDPTEILFLLETPDQLKAKVAEAREVLRNVSAAQQGNATAEQLSSISLIS